MRNSNEVSSWKGLGGLIRESLWMCAHAGALAHASGKALNVDSTELCWFSRLLQEAERKHDVQSITVQGPSSPSWYASIRHRLTDLACRAGRYMCTLLP